MAEKKGGMKVSRFGFNSYKQILCFCILLLNTSCAVTNSYTIEGKAAFNEKVDNAIVYDNFYFSEVWFAKNETNIVKYAYDFIKSRHPDVAPDFPKVGKVFSEDIGIDWVVTELANKFSINEGQGEVWDIHIHSASYVAKLNPKSIESAAVQAYGIFCWASTFLLICPEVNSKYVKLDVEFVKQSTGESFEVSGYGGSTRLISSPWVDGGTDDVTKRSEQNAKALSAAIASAVDQWILHYEKGIDLNVTKVN